MSAVTWVRGAVVGLVVVLGAPLACSSDESSEARAGSACDTSAECADGARCVGSRSAARCLSREDAPCSAPGDCPSELQCAPDLECRSTCRTLEDCPRGQTCAASGQCAEPGEVDSTGVLVDAVPAAGGRTGAGGQVSAGGRTGAGGGLLAGGRTGSGGASAGGRVGAGGFLATGGRTAAGGAVDPDRCEPATWDNDCQACVLTKCCSEYFACDDDTCAGTASTAGELMCFQDCMAAFITENGFANSDTVLGCASQCAESGSSLGSNTDALITCMLSGGSPVDGGTVGCSIECYGVDLSF